MEHALKCELPSNIDSCVVFGCFHRTRSHEEKLEKVAGQRPGLEDSRGTCQRLVQHSRLLKAYFEKGREHT